MYLHSTARRTHTGLDSEQAARFVGRLNRDAKSTNGTQHACTNSDPIPKTAGGCCGAHITVSATAFAQKLGWDFDALVKRLQSEKPAFAERQKKLLAERYDLSDRPATGVTMSRGKPVQAGVRVKLPGGLTWEQLAAMSPEEIKSKNQWPAGFYPLPHPHHEAGGMIFPQPLIDETKRQTSRDLTRFDLDFDLPQHLLPEFPAPIYLTTRPDLGDVSQGQPSLVTVANYRPVQKHPQSQTARRLAVAGLAVPAGAVNATEDRRTLLGTWGELLRLPRQRPHRRGDARWVTFGPMSIGTH
jgi:hypothetical protein